MKKDSDQIIINSNGQAKNHHSLKVKLIGMKQIFYLFLEEKIETADLEKLRFSTSQILNIFL